MAVYVMSVLAKKRVKTSEGVVERVAHKPSVVSADGLEQAKEHACGMSKTVFPDKDGWYEHDAYVRMIPEATMLSMGYKKLAKTK